MIKQSFHLKIVVLLLRLDPDLSLALGVNEEGITLSLKSNIGIQIRKKVYHL